MSSIDFAAQERLLSEYALLHQGDDGGKGGLLFDVGDRSLLELTGKDRATFLHNFCTNDIKGLQPGRGCEAFLTNIKGRVLEHLFIFADIESLWIDGTPGYEEAVRGHLDRYLITEDVQIHPRSAERKLVWLVGRAATEFVQARCGDLAIPGAPLQHLWVADGMGEGVHIRRFDLGGFPGWQVSGSRSAIDEVVSQVKERGVQPGRGELYEALRIESGLPRYGVDITDEHLAQECRRTAAAISFTKGCYLGQEPIARIDALGHVNRELCILEGSSAGDEIEVGSALIDQAGNDVGKLTSAAWHPKTRSTWGLSVLKRSASEEGTRLVAGDSGARLSMTVHAPLSPRSA